MGQRSMLYASCGHRYQVSLAPHNKSIPAYGSASLMGSLVVRLSTVQGARLFGFLCFFAHLPGLSISLSLIASNTAGFTKKSVGTSLYTIMYCVGNISGPFLFQAKDAPRYIVRIPKNHPTSQRLTVTFRVATTALLGALWPR